MIIRPNSVNRHTLENIMETNCYTINHINKDIYKKAHQTSARYPKEISEFDAVGLTQEFHNKINTTGTLLSFDILKIQRFEKLGIYNN